MGVAEKIDAGSITTQEKIKAAGQEVIDLLIEKNKSYGDSALEPANIFAKGDAVENLCARIDDKLMRIKTQGFRGYGEDNIKDLTGYFILLKIAIANEDSNSALQDWQSEILVREKFYTTTT